MTAKPLMVVGTASSAGKSLMVTALCRIFKRRGYSVAPFKSQNMSLNSFVTEEGHEMGRAQVVQAEAAGLKPKVLMNPILLKPTTNKKSQVIVNGKVHGNMSAVEYYAYKDQLRPVVAEAFAALAAKHDVVVIEGAGSPTEINLTDNDFVNMGMAAMADAPVILVGDIDRGGVFASLYGTVKLMPEEDQKRIKGLLINKFRGDVKILEPGLRQIEDILNIPVMGVIPYGKFAIDEEDSLTDRFTAKNSSGLINIAVVRLPRISNFTDFAVFDSFSQVSLSYVENPWDLNSADLIIIPGSKNTIEDMRFLIESGLADKIKTLAASGRVVAGICGGFQMLGKTIKDPHQVESRHQSIDGLGILDVETSLSEVKQTVQATVKIKNGPGVLSNVGGHELVGYEIHMGRTTLGPEVINIADGPGDKMAAVAVNKVGNVFGSYLHGFFDNLSFTGKLLSSLMNSLGKTENEAESLLVLASYQEFKEKEYDRLADMVEANVNFDEILKITGL